MAGLTLTGTASLLGVRPESARAEPPPETTTLRIAEGRPGICIAPQYVAAGLLAGEGFTNVQYLPNTTFAERLEALARGEAQMTVTFVSSLISRVDAGDPIVMIAGSHIGCFELFGTDRVRAIRDLKDKTVAILDEGAPDHLFLSVILLQIGLDPRRDVNWVKGDAIRLLADGKVECGLGFPSCPTGAPGSEDRSCHFEQQQRAAVVAVLLLCRGRSSRLCQEAPGSDKASRPGDDESRRRLRARA